MSADRVREARRAGEQREELPTPMRPRPWRVQDGSWGRVRSSNGKQCGEMAGERPGFQTETRSPPSVHGTGSAQRLSWTPSEAPLSSAHGTSKQEENTERFRKMSSSHWEEPASLPTPIEGQGPLLAPFGTLRGLEKPDLVLRARPESQPRCASLTDNFCPLSFKWGRTR